MCDQIFGVCKNYGIDEKELKSFFIRFTQFLILDKAIYELELRGEEITPENVFNKLKETNEDGNNNCPSIANLNDYVKAYIYRNKILKENRKAISTGKAKSCEFILGCPINKIGIGNSKIDVSIQKDHIIPKRWGGEDSNNNVQFLCKRHNFLKMDQNFWDEGLLPLRGWNFEF